jgi:ankyrin repeat protein
MPHRRTRPTYRIGTTQLAVAVLAGLAIITSPGCGGGGWSKNLYGAAQKGNLKSAERYLDEGESISAANAEDGRTPLHAAAKGGHRKMVTFLLNQGASVNARDNEGDTPLHLAAAAGHDSTVRILLADGADATMRNNAGETPLDLAVGHPDVSNDLRRAGG